MFVNIWQSDDNNNFDFFIETLYIIPVSSKTI